MVAMDECRDDHIAQKRASDLFFFLGSFGVLATLVGSGFIVAAVTL
jgi:hypothetical protein